VGIRNGTGELAQPIILRVNPTRKVNKARYGMTIPKKDWRPHAPAPIYASSIRTRTASRGNMYIKFIYLYLSF